MPLALSFLLLYHVRINCFLRRFCIAAYRIPHLDHAAGQA